MAQKADFDFEKAWQKKLSDGLDQFAGEDIRLEIMSGSENLTGKSDAQCVIAWSQDAMDKLDLLLDEPTRRKVMLSCACQYPKDGLVEARETYRVSRDVDAALGVLQAQFETFLRETLALREEWVELIVERKWGLAGERRGHQIIATKIPKSGNLEAYLQEADPVIRRQLYCHCPRIREVLKSSESLSTTYCYCGAGFYKGIWEEIIGEEVELTVVKSVLNGDEVCQFVIDLPEHICISERL